MRHVSLRSGQELRANPPRRRHWWRWALGSVLALVVLAVAATGLVVTLTPGPAPLALPKDAAVPSGPLDGTWRVTTGSVAGFRVRETVIGFSNDVTGRTGDVTGRAALTGRQVTHARFRGRGRAGTASSDRWPATGRLSSSSSSPQRQRGNDGHAIRQGTG